MENLPFMPKAPMPLPPLTSPNNNNKFCSSDFIHPRFWVTWFSIALLRLISCLSYPCQLWMGKRLGRLIRRLPGCRQSVVEINLQLCFPEKSDKEREQIKNECYESIGIALVEMAMCWWWSDKRLKSLVEIRGLEHLETVLAGGQGAILLSGHFTSLEIGTRLFALTTPLQVMYRTQRNALLDRYLYSKRCGYLENVISKKNTRQLIKGIKKLIPTWYAPDQNFSSERNAFAPFMGVPTATITASSRLVRSAGCAMLPFYTYRKPDGTGYILTIEPPLENFPSGDDFLDATAINASIEKFVRSHPEQYMWLHQRFKSRPDGEPSLYP
jgi:KDO2-lipid IV(A) lauroyltransferase